MGGNVIPADELYKELNNPEMQACANSISMFEYNNCPEDEEIIRVATDYFCRYIGVRFYRRRPTPSGCYCCGYTYSYVEYGDICTAFCDEKKDEERKTGISPVIRLPFNWGDSCPEHIVTSDGEELECNENTYYENFGKSAQLRQKSEFLNLLNGETIIR